MIGPKWAFLIGLCLGLEQWCWFQNEAVGSQVLWRAVPVFLENGISTFVFVEWIKTMLLAHENIEGTGQFFFNCGVQLYLGVPSINLWFVGSYLVKYAHNDLISDFSIFGIHSVIF